MAHSLRQISKPWLTEDAPTWPNVNVSKLFYQISLLVICYRQLSSRVDHTGARRLSVPASAVLRASFSATAEPAKQSPPGAEPAGAKRQTVNGIPIRCADDSVSPEGRLRPGTKTARGCACLAIERTHQRTDVHLSGELKLFSRPFLNET
jgi:hypothetical protein